MLRGLGITNWHWQETLEKSDLGEGERAERGEWLKGVCQASAGEDAPTTAGRDRLRKNSVEMAL
jgi:hypothetical protein